MHQCFGAVRIGGQQYSGPLMVGFNLYLPLISRAQLSVKKDAQTVRIVSQRLSCFLLQYWYASEFGHPPEECARILPVTICINDTLE